MHRSRNEPTSHSHAAIGSKNYVFKRIDRSISYVQNKGFCWTKWRKRSQMGQYFLHQDTNKTVSVKVLCLFIRRIRLIRCIRWIRGRFVGFVSDSLRRMIRCNESDDLRITRFASLCFSVQYCHNLKRHHPPLET